MALPGSGQICFSQLRSEFGYSGQVCMSTFFNTRFTCRGGGYCLSNWRGYDHLPCNTVLNIDWTVPSFASCWNVYSFGASVEGLNTAVVGDVTVTINWYGDLGGYFNGQVTISSGTVCGINYWVYSQNGVSCAGENVSWTSVSISPMSNGSQIYNPGNQIPFYNC